jgi:hypothetical protein
MPVRVGSSEGLGVTAEMLTANVAVERLEALYSDEPREPAFYLGTMATNYVLEVEEPEMQENKACKCKPDGRQS